MKRFTFRTAGLWAAANSTIIGVELLFICVQNASAGSYTNSDLQSTNHPDIASVTVDSRKLKIVELEFFCSNGGASASQGTNVKNGQTATFNFNDYRSGHACYNSSWEDAYFEAEVKIKVYGIWWHCKDLKSSSSLRWRPRHNTKAPSSFWPVKSRPRPRSPTPTSRQDRTHRNHHSA